jgi:hypothetical protein
MRNILIFLEFLCCACAAFAQVSGTFTPTGSMIAPRYQHTATLLADGRVLIAGGLVPQGPGAPGAPLATAEVYDPRTETFTLTGSMIATRTLHTATLLPDGRVLIAGGDCSNGTAELYDPATGAFTGAGNMVTLQFGQTATLLGNGKVLLAYGTACPPAADREGAPLAAAELYDPVTGTFTAAGANPTDWGTYGIDTATLLADGRVLFAGQDPAQIYDTNTDAFSLAGSSRGTGWWGVDSHSATLLQNGTVLLAGGADYIVTYASAAIYDPAGNTFIATNRMNNPRQSHTGTLLSDGSVLVAGGSADCSEVTLACIPTVYASTELYDAHAARFALSRDMTQPRALHSATLLPDGTVLIAGGFTDTLGRQTAASAEIYHPANP